MSYAIMRAQKLKAHQVQFSQNHNERKNKNYSNSEIDLEKTKDNYHLEKCEDYNQKLKEQLEERYTKDKAIRKDAVMSVEIIYTSDKKFFEKLDPEQERKFFEKSLEFTKEYFGEKNIISAVIHKDETTPHMHVNIVPLTPEGNLSATYFMDGRKTLEVMQDRYFEKVSKEFPDLERGTKKSITNAKHIELQEFKKNSLEKLQKEQEKISKEIEKYKENYSMDQNIKKIYQEAKPTMLNKAIVTIEKNKLKKIASLALKTEISNETINKLILENEKIKSENIMLNSEVKTLEYYNKNNNITLDKNFELKSQNKKLEIEKNQLNEFIEKKGIKKEFQQFQKEKLRKKEIER